LITGCYNIGNIAEVVITIEPRPEITDTTLEPIVVCADEQADDATQAENQAVATIDLTERDVEINPNFDNPDNNTIVEYFASEEDFLNGIAIEDPANYVTTQTPTIIFAQVVDLDNFCTSFTTQSFEIQVNPLPLVDISEWDGAIICINPLTGEVIGTDFSPPVFETGLSEEFYSFEWTRNGVSLAANGSVYTPNQAGTYTVTVTDITNNLTSCQASSTATIIESNPPTFEVNVLSLAFDRSHSLEIFNIQGTGDYEFSIDNGPWQSLEAGQESIIFSGLDAGDRIVRGRDSGGCGELTLTVSLIHYPRFFTPNEDGYNDTWNIIGLANQPNAKIYIFDRHGKLLKQLSPSGEGWDGTYNGKQMIGNDYWFRVEYDEPSNGARREFKANFTLKR
jgi:gliding motility-associated-like protein